MVSVDVTGVNSRNEVVNVGVTSVIVSEDVSVRSLFFVRNTSTAGQIITITFGKVAVANYGIQLKPDEYFMDSISDGRTPYSGTITAISDNAGGQLSVVEL